MSITTEDYRKLYPSLMAYALSRCKNKSIAEDLVSQTFLTAVEKLERGLNITDLNAWCITVLRNKHIDYVRKKTESQLNVDVSAEEQIQDGGVSADPFSQIIFSNCFGKMKENYSEVLSMSLVAGITTKVIAELLEKPQNTILSWLAKAKLEFYDCVRGND